MALSSAITRQKIVFKVAILVAAISTRFMKMIKCLTFVKWEENKCLCVCIDKIDFAYIFLGATAENDTENMNIILKSIMLSSSSECQINVAVLDHDKLNLT